MAGTASRKRPCRVCKRWFLPNPRVKDRQKTCVRPKCQREWHRRKCAEWNQKNADYFKANYLAKKIEQTRSEDPAFRFKSGLPCRFVQEVIGLNHLVIIEYQTQLISRQYRAFMKALFPVAPDPVHRQPGMMFSRGDPGLTSRKS